LRGQKYRERNQRSFRKYGKKSGQLQVCVITGYINAVHTLLVDIISCWPNLNKHKNWGFYLTTTIYKHFWTSYSGFISRNRRFHGIWSHTASRWRTWKYNRFSV